MDLLETDITRERVDDIVHLDTQLAPNGLDLTVGAVFELQGDGQLDFGGGEYKPANREKLAPELRDEDDDYGWWELDEGSYVIRYNETVQPKGDEIGRVRPLDRLLQAGALHADFDLEGDRENLETLLWVGTGGVNLKENFRASRLEIYDLSN